MLRAIRSKLSGNGRWILGEDRLLLIVALPEPDALSAPQIDCRPDLHRRSSRRCRQSREADGVGESGKGETPNMAHAHRSGKSPARGALLRKSLPRNYFPSCATACD